MWGSTDTQGASPWWGSHSLVPYLVWRFFNYQSQLLLFVAVLPSVYPRDLQLPPSSRETLEIIT